jgi:hypothetical protein
MKPARGGIVNTEQKTNFVAIPNDEMKMRETMSRFRRLKI